MVLKPALFINLYMVHAIMLIGETLQQVAFINLPLLISDFFMYMSK